LANSSSLATILVIFAGLGMRINQQVVEVYFVKDLDQLEEEVVQVFVLINQAIGSTVALTVNIIGKIEFWVASDFLELVWENVRTILALVKCIAYNITLTILGGFCL